MSSVGSTAVQYSYLNKCTHFHFFHFQQECHVFSLSFFCVLCEKSQISKLFVWLNYRSTVFQDKFHFSMKNMHSLPQFLSSVSCCCFMLSPPTRREEIKAGEPGKRVDRGVCFPLWEGTVKSIQFHDFCTTVQPRFKCSNVYETMPLPALCAMAAYVALSCTEQ